jgi:protein-S-isoprenylcysteine O-methyltransferase Ste14
MRRRGLLVQALAAFLLLPGVVAFLVPVLVFAPDPGAFVDRRGFFPLALGLVLLLWCVREFYVAGRGTLAPWAPPEALVVTGPYRRSRNPMYVAVFLVLCGWAVVYRSTDLAVYAVVVLIAFHVRVVLFEEPFLERTQEGWPDYRVRVPRWFTLRG